MPYQTCRHVKEDGHLCQSPAVRGEHFCHFHQSHRTAAIAIAQARVRGEHPGLYLPPLKDPWAVQYALSDLLNALGAGEIDHKRANIILRVLRTASDNFKNGNIQPARPRPALIAPDRGPGGKHVH